MNSVLGHVYAACGLIHSRAPLPSFYNLTDVSRSHFREKYIDVESVLLVEVLLRALRLCYMQSLAV